ncbi:MAG: class I SAM-dependent methyltransferase [Treponema sp.]|jgi:16S rRNA (guanine527-N7)-methyltransferase|nr:class I SAM-dependent methyltransferase [Treponema sp.]
MTDILRGGLARLCEGDRDIAALIAPRLETVVSLLEKYIAEIELFNGAYGLVSAGSREELVTRHILDSLAPLGIIARTLAGIEAPAIADAGSGAGLPGIPLAVCLAPARAALTLIDRMGRRAGFLRNTLAILGLPGLGAEEREIEKAEGGRFDLVVFRAFRPLDPPMYRALSRLLRAGGESSGRALAAWKGRMDSIAGEMRSLEAALKAGGGPLSWEPLPCPVPFLNEERHLLLIRPGI